MPTLTRKKTMILVASLILVPLLVCLFVLFVLLTAADRSVLFGREKTLSHEGVERTYRVHVPSSLSEDTKLIVGLHGFGDTSRRFAYYTGLHNAAPDAVVVYPQAVAPDQEGVRHGWNADFCCGSGWVTKTDDVGFITSLVSTLVEEYNLQPDNVFVTGFSNGSFMTQRLAAERPDVFRAAAAASGSIGTAENKLTPTAPIPILLMHGEQDRTVPFNGGPGASDPDFTWLSAEETAAVWEAVNADEATTQIETFPEDGHKWHGWRLLNVWTRKPEASQKVVEFFESISN